MGMCGPISFLLHYFCNILTCWLLWSHHGYIYFVEFQKYRHALFYLKVYLFSENSSPCKLTQYDIILHRNCGFNQCNSCSIAPFNFNFENHLSLSGKCHYSQAESFKTAVKCTQLFNNLPIVLPPPSKSTRCLPSFRRSYAWHIQRQNNSIHHKLFITSIEVQREFFFSRFSYHVEN